jgi:hypothetical protein
MTETRTLYQAEAECRAAWAAQPNATHGWCIHHEQEWEELTEPIENRIAYVLSAKASHELITRLDNMRPMSPGALRQVRTADKAYREATAPAWKAYREATATAGKAYREATATAGKAYREAVATAEKAYNEATAPARKVYRKATAAAHAKDVPRNTWTGESIFN